MLVINVSSNTFIEIYHFKRSLKMTLQNVTALKENSTVSSPASKVKARDFVQFSALDREIER